jgi:hypothetical protein
MRFAALLALLVLPLVSGCDSNEPDTPSIGGLYSFSSVDPDDGTTSRATFDIPTTESGTFTLGSRSVLSGTLSDGTTVSFPVTGSGTYDYPNIQMTVRVSAGGETQTDNLTGTVSASGSSITVRDSDGVTLLLTR